MTYKQENNKISEESSIEKKTSLEFDPKQDSLDDIIFSRIHFLREKTHWLEMQIYNREKLWKENIDKIDSDIMYLDTKLMTHNMKWGRHFDLETDKIKSQMEKEIANLHKEKRAEATVCWKEINNIKTLLLEALQEYKQAKIKFFNFYFY